MINYNSNYVDEPLKATLQKENETNHFSDKKLGYKALKNATVLPAKCVYGDWHLGGGIISENGYEEGSVGISGGEVGFAYAYDKTAVIRSKETVIYLGMFVNIWGHLITDHLAFMWFLKSEYFNRYKECRLIYCSHFNDLPANFIELISLLGISADKLTRVTVPTEYANVILPERCFFVADGIKRFTKEYRALIDEIVEKVPASTDGKYEKIYFTRARFAKNDVGEKKLERFFTRHGYTVVSPEKYTFKQQLAMLKRCKHLAATDGSVSHNSIFMNEGSEVLLLNRANYLADYSFVLNQVNNVSVTYISANLSILVPKERIHIGPNFYYVSDNLLKYFGEETLLDTPKYWIENFKDFKKYLQKYPVLDNIGERISQPYYYEKLQANLQKYYHIRKRTFPYCFMRIKYIPKRIRNYLRRKRA